jgi:putative ABC transport system permease protein
VIRDLQLGPIVRALARQRTALALVVLELATGFVFISSLLLTGSWYLRTAGTPLGYDEGPLVSVMVHRPAAPGGPAPALEVARRRGEAELSAIAALPGVAAVAPLSTLLAAETWSRASLVTRPDQPSSRTLAWPIFTAPSLQQVIGLRFVEGAMPAPADDRVVITRSLRDRLFPPGTAALGRTLALDQLTTVVVAGVVEDVLLRERFGPSAYLVVLRFAGPVDEREARYLVRARPGARAAVLAALPTVLGRSGPDQVVAIAPSDASHSDRRVFARVIVGMLAMTGATIAFIALLGVLAVSSFLVTQRTRQLGIRRALGGTRGAIVRLILVETWLATVLGMAIGLAVTLALVALMRPLFAGLSVDWRLLAVTAAVLWADCTIAALIPARRAARISPSVASRSL